MTSRSPCQPQPFCDSVCSLVLLHFLSIRTLHVPSKSTAQCVSQLGGRPSVSIHTVVHQWYPREVWADLFLSGTLWGPLTHAAEHKATSCQMRNKAITSGHTGPFSPLTSLPECHPVPKWFLEEGERPWKKKRALQSSHWAKRTGWDHVVLVLFTQFCIILVISLVRKLATEGFCLGGTGLELITNKSESLLHS